MATPLPGGSEVLNKNLTEALPQSPTSYRFVRHFDKEVLFSHTFYFTFSLKVATLFVSTDAIFTLHLNRFKTYLLARRDCNNFLDLQLKQAAINISRPSALHTNRHAPIKGPKRLSKYGEKRSTVSAKGNKLEGFSQNGCKPGTPF